MFRIYLHKWRKYKRKFIVVYLVKRINDLSYFHANHVQLSNYYKICCFYQNAINNNFYLYPAWFDFGIINCNILINTIHFRGLQPQFFLLFSSLFVTENSPCKTTKLFEEFVKLESFEIPNGFKFTYRKKKCVLYIFFVRNEPITIENATLILNILNVTIVS